MSPDSSTTDPNSGSAADTDATDAAAEICGESFDHDTEITYEDEETCHWICRRCDAEGWEDFDD